MNLEWDPRPSVTVVMAAEGYPGHYERDRVINDLEQADRLPGVKVFHAGTTLRTDTLGSRESRVVTDGGRATGVRSATISLRPRRATRPSGRSAQRCLVPARRADKGINAAVLILPPPALPVFPDPPKRSKAFLAERPGLHACVLARILRQ
ncbi:MAG: phosphoribosylglycinamide synthetase C domain-containing protein [Isosphaeraceae bacterium]